MTDEDVVQLAADCLNGNITGPYGPYKDNKKPYWYAHCSGEKAYTMMKAILPFMGKRRTEQIKTLMEKYENLARGH